MADFSLKLAKLNFDIRYPGGEEEFAAELMEAGSYMSRFHRAMLTDDPIAEELFPPLRAAKAKLATQKDEVDKND